MNRLVFWLPIAVAMLILAEFSVETARADSIEGGHIVNIEDNEIYINMSKRRGLSPGDSLRIKRPFQIKHPVTRKLVSDWLPIGTATITMVGQTLAMARLDGDLLARVKVGDIVEVLVLSPEPLAKPEPVPEPPTEPASAPTPAEPLPEIASDTQAVLAVWIATAGAPLEARIGAWEEFLASQPGSPYAEVVKEDLETLRALREELVPAELALGGTRAGHLVHDAPERGRAGETLPLAFLIDTPDLAAAWVHYRTRGSATFDKALLRREGQDYLRGEIPGRAIIGPGIEYFVEIATQRGEVGAAVGSPEAPLYVAVPEPPLSSVFAPTRRRSRVTLTSTYLDFATFDERGGERTDAFYLFEADFLYRIRKGLYGVRTGIGALNGQGGFANRVYDQTNPAPKAGFNFGYVELEWRGKYDTALSGRLVAGVGREGFGLGVEGRFRLGAEDATNLSLGVSQVEEIGFLTEMRMQWNAVAKVPLGLAVALTDQPASGDLGVRLTTDLGYRALSWVQPTLRISYQARTVVHSGIGAGLGLVFDW